MEQPQNFRSAFNGFNREDVVHYLEFINTKHTNEVTRLNRENDDLRRHLENSDPTDVKTLHEQCDALEAELDAVHAEKAELENELTAMQAEKAELEARIAELEQALEEAKQAPAEVPAPKAAPAPEKPVLFQSATLQELEAYRRAERAERVAKERAGVIYQQTSGILTSATAQVEEAAQQISAVTDSVMAQLSLLQSAVGSSRLALQEAAATMYSLRPGEEE